MTHLTNLLRFTQTFLYTGAKPLHLCIGLCPGEKYVYIDTYTQERVKESGQWPEHSSERLGTCMWANVSVQKQNCNHKI